MTPHAVEAPLLGQYHAVPMVDVLSAEAGPEPYSATWLNPASDRALSPWACVVRITAGFGLLIAVLVALEILAGR